METIKRGRRLIEQWEAVLTLLNTAALIIGALVATWIALIKGRAEAKKETASIDNDDEATAVASMDVIRKASTDLVATTHARLIESLNNEKRLRAENRRYRAVLYDFISKLYSLNERVSAVARDCSNMAQEETNVNCKGYKVMHDNIEQLAALAQGLAVEISTQLDKMNGVSDEHNP